jgi:glutamine cyclotransferase
METLRMKAALKFLFFIILCVLTVRCDDRPDAPANNGNMIRPVKRTPSINYSVVATYPHDKTAYTEGLLFHEGRLLESTGYTSNLPQTRSAIGVVDLKTGNFDTKVELDKKIYFGEGIVVLNNKLYQLTYKNQMGFIYDARSFKKIGQFGYPNKEGWGMTTDGKNLIFSDGTYNLSYLDPQTLKVTKALTVTENGYALQNLNELEFINGYIYANVWLTNRIVKIDTATGQVVGSLELDGIFSNARAKDNGLNELNGIAYDSTSGKILVTGKLWPHIYEIKFAI